MLLLLFSTRTERYAINCEYIFKVIPFLNLQPIPMTPAYVAGAVKYRGTDIPVIDLSQLLENVNCRCLLSTRIIVIEYGTDTRITGNNYIGLLAEKVNETVKTPKDWKPDQDGDSPCFIDPAIVSQDMIQMFEPKKMLPDNLSNSLFMEYSSRREHR